MNDQPYPLESAAPARGLEESLSSVARGDAEQILRRRADAYAQVATPVEVGTQIEALLLRLGDEQYAVETRLLRSVQSPKGLTPVPSTPTYVAGILNVRGEIITVLDLGIALGLIGPVGQTESAGVLLVDLPPIRVGLLVDEVLGVRPLALDRLDRGFSDRDLVRGVAESRIVLLDLERLLSGGRLDVLEDVS